MANPIKTSEGPEQLLSSDYVYISLEEWAASVRKLAEALGGAAVALIRAVKKEYRSRPARAYRRSKRNQPSAWTTRKDEWLWDTFGCDLELRAANAATHNRKRNKHGRTGVSRKERTHG